MVWKNYLKLSDIARYSKLARASKAPPPLGGIGLKNPVLLLFHPLHDPRNETGDMPRENCQTEPVSL